MCVDGISFKTYCFYLFTISFLFLLQNPFHVGSGGGQSSLAWPLGILDSSGHIMS